MYLMWPGFARTLLHSWRKLYLLKYSRDLLSPTTLYIYYSLVQYLYDCIEPGLSVSTGCPHPTILLTFFRNITSLLVKFALYMKKNSVKWILVQMFISHEFHFTWLFIKDKNRVMWGLPVINIQFNCSFSNNIP